MVTINHNKFFGYASRTGGGGGGGITLYIYGGTYGLVYLWLYYLTILIWTVTFNVTKLATSKALHFPYS